MELGVQGLVSIGVQLMSVWLVWNLLAVVKWDKLIHFPLSKKAIMFKIVIAIAIGHSLSSFILKYLDYSLLLRYFVEIP